MPVAMIHRMDASDSSITNPKPWSTRMTRLMMSEFQDTFDDFQHQVFRLETLDFYDSPSEREPLARFRAGQPQDSTWRARWTARVRTIRKRGATIGRVHVVTEPLTEYVRFEMTCAYPSNVEDGEDVRILPRGLADELGVPTIDFWLFDDERTAIMVYDESGALTHIEVTRDPDTVRDHARWRDLTRAHAIPLRQYLTSVGLEPQVGRTATK
ncbi:DUF6879 family protein [Nocardiopsis sp. NPDC049922]|uniref:DUF6879 family protein n=1 Tax=Nocardiopsis sp. NPDC049922 TaxID=3155157 RepID=UPI0033C41D20